jgi:hypothetical protein
MMNVNQLQQAKVVKGVQSSSDIGVQNRPVSISEDDCTILLG